MSFDGSRSGSSGATVELQPALGHSPLLEDLPRTAVSLPAFAPNHTVQMG